MKHYTKVLSALLLCSLLLSSCGTAAEDTQTTTEATTAASVATTTAEQTLTTTAATEQVTTPTTTAESTTAQSTTTTVATTTQPPAPTIVDPATLPMIYTQEDVCNEPYLGDYSYFAQCAEETFTVPGLNQSLVPQGMDYWEERGWMLISGYCTDTSLNGGKGSVLLAVDLESGKLMGEHYLKDQRGANYTGHAGGVAITEKNLFISESKHLYRIPLSALDEAGQCGDIRFAESIRVPVNGSFCNYSGGILWVGDFQYSTSYTTESYRHMTNRLGDTYKAWTVGYVLDSTTENELKSSAMVKNSYATPDYVFSITSKVQGMTYLPEVGRVALSISYGRKNNSYLYFYPDPLKEGPHTTTTINGTSVPVWFLDGVSGMQEMLALPMSEGIANVDGKLYVLFESGAMKYRLDGGKFPTDVVYSVDITKG